MTDARRGEIALLLVKSQMSNLDNPLIEKMLKDSAAVASRLNIDPGELAEFVTAGVVDILGETVRQLELEISGSKKSSPSPSQLELFECPGYPAPKAMSGLAEFHD